MTLMRFLNALERRLVRWVRRFVLWVAHWRLTEDTRVLSLRLQREALWHEAGGEYRLKYDFDLSESSLVIDVGGFEGYFAGELFVRHKPRMMIFEPVSSYFNGLVNRFGRNSSFTLINKALGGSSRQDSIYLGSGASSLSKGAETSDTFEVIDVIDVADVIREVGSVDLLALNCEGGEYEILRRLIDCQLQQNIKCFFIQFHDLSPTASADVGDIMARLKETHRVDFEFPWVWTKLSLKT
ncbi:MAG: FkbM family methyltransferase [Pseudomonadota bacterium]